MGVSRLNVETGTWGICTSVVKELFWPSGTGEVSVIGLAEAVLTGGFVGAD